MSNKKVINKVDTSSNKLELLVTIVPKKKADYYVYLIQSFDVNMQLKILAKGAASTEILEYLGLHSDNKLVILSPIKVVNREKILNAIEHAFSTIKNGRGIAFITPMSSIVGKLAYGFLSNNEKFIQEEN